MVFMHFPASLTEEEEILKQTLSRLKKKKKQVQALKAAATNQEKEVTHSKTTNKPAPPPSMDSADKATEQAKKLVQSGAIKVMSQKEKSGFKRSKTFEKKKDTEKPVAPVGFQPFMSFAGDEEEERPPPSKQMKGLNESFVPAGYNNRSFDRPDREYREPPKKGNTVYVHGIRITEDLVRNVFSPFGKIIKIRMETEKHTAFVTFEDESSADQAVAKVSGTMVSNIRLDVELARRQPMVDGSVDGSSKVVWSNIAASNSQKGATSRDKRGVVSYDDIF